MSISRKYGRTYHYDFSLGTTSDDRINHEWWEDMLKIKEVVHTEKLDGENTCLNEIGVFARSHAAPTRHPWADYLKQKHAIIQKDLKDMNIEIFGENLYAIHSIIYPNIEDHFYVFAVRSGDMWLSWEEVKFYAGVFDFKTVPEFGIAQPKDFTEEEFKSTVLKIVGEPSTFGSQQNNLDGPITPCLMEGLVTRNIGEYPVDKFKENVFKWVRKDHVQTDAHWSSRITRAMLKHEREAMEAKKEENE